MTERASAADMAYMRRLGDFKAQSKRDALEEHRALSVTERIQRGIEFARRRPPLTERRNDDDLPAFFERARQLGPYKS
jgi:hypothetical protein